jgi:hypothetical protein
MAVRIMTRTQKILTVFLLALGIGWRLLPHASNFAPVGAIAILAGLYLPKRWAIIVPVLIMATSDLAVGLHRLSLLIWATYGLIGLLAYSAKGRLQGWRAVGFAPLSAVLFFLITNFGVWAQGQMYERSWSGLIHCYYMGLPFIRATLVSDMVFTVVLIAIARRARLPRLNYVPAWGIKQTIRSSE